MAPALFTLNTSVTIPWPAQWTEAVNSTPAVPINQPAIPASATAALNDNPFPVSVAIAGGTVTVVAVNGTTVATSSPATVTVPAFGTIAITYSVIPTSWTWTQVIDQTSGAMQQVQVSAVAPPDGQVGQIPQYTFQKGMIITADSTAITPGTLGSGPQQLYAAIGGGNLNAYRIGTDAVGHAALAN